VIKAVIFDVGGVLIRTPNRSKRLNWERKLGLDEWQSEVIIFGGEMGTKAQLGDITNAQLWDWVGERLNLSPSDLQRFRADFWAGDILDISLVDYIRSIRPGYQTAIISNATDALRESLTDTYPIVDDFDLIVCSAEEHLMKPTDEIYFRTLERLDRSPAEAVFIDDSEANVQAARKVGMAAIHFHPNLNLADALAPFGVNGGKNEQA
jgi:epoxide hydrolase-like predicted phosphatase